MQQRLNVKLLNLNNSGLYPFHMPGHKRNIDLACDEDDSFGKRLAAVYGIDITEIDGFDNLHDANDVIKDAENRAAKLYKSEETHFLVNGSSCGILAAISAVAQKGKKIIVARNCHISVYNAIELNELDPVFVYPDLIARDDISGGISGGISVSSLEKAILSNPDACAVLVTSPTYDGVISDIYEIAKLAHEYDMPLIVDEAHGALFFIEGRSAVLNGADIVINSVHKTLPALTQTALIHINGNIVNRDRVRKYLRIFQTSSPSYVLMGSIDYAVEIMEKAGARLYREFCIRTLALKDKLKKLRNLKYIEKDNIVPVSAFDFDESKVIIASGSSSLSGKNIYNVLINKYGIQPEMAAGDYVLLMTTLFDTNEGIDRLVNALYEIDDNCKSSEYLKECLFFTDENAAEECESGDEDKLYNLKNSINYISKWTVYSYPPGIPIIVAGERVTDSTYDEIEKAINNKLDVKWIEQ